MIKYVCDICSNEISGERYRGIFFQPQAFGKAQEMDFCERCFRVLTKSKDIKVSAPRPEPDISAMELKITDEREDNPEDKPVKARKSGKKTVKVKLVDVEEESAEKPKEEPLEKPKIKTGRPKKEKPEPMPEPDEPDESETKKHIDYGKMLALYRANWPIDDIAEDLHCGKSTVYAYIAKCRKEGKL